VRAAPQHSEMDTSSRAVAAAWMMQEQGFVEAVEAENSKHFLCALGRIQVLMFLCSDYSRGQAEEDECIVEQS
jgi:hypothetical protein